MVKLGPEAEKLLEGIPLACWCERLGKNAVEAAGELEFIRGIHLPLKPNLFLEKLQLDQRGVETSKTAPNTIPCICHDVYTKETARFVCIMHVDFD